ncbi:MAG: hypothetical protein A2X12_12225 [Bacteroidetes bacterium GWE2_29_8]|nr:MAG: hypothetical protein A2X12_12225 [Bacteroidetes bacterium GWE2_29_8]OFY21321.1 MAG: hypothetical protein A2X02_05245 [Bacteroidetes bacterium GWF2_29_10]
MKQFSIILLLSAMFLLGFSQTKIKNYDIKFPKKPKTSKLLKSNEMLADSSSFYDWTNNSWVLNTTQYIEFGCNKDINYAYYIVNDNGNDIIYRQNHYKNTNGKDSVIIIEKNVLESWVLAEKLEYKYNSNNDIIEEFYYEYSNSGWVLMSKSITYYNANNQQTGVSFWKYNQYSGSVYEYYTETYTYSGSTITQIDFNNIDDDFQGKYVNIIWYDQSKFLFSEFVFEVYEGSAYSIWFKRVSTYNSSGKVTIDNDYGYYEGSFDSQPGRTYKYTYDSKVNLLTLTEEGFDDNGDWGLTHNESYTYSYDVNNNITQKIYESYDNNVLATKTKEENIRYIDVTPFTLTTSLDQSINNGDSVTLDASGADKYLWSTGEVTSSINVSPSMTTSYTVTGKISGCKETASIIVTVTIISGIDKTIEKTNAIKVYPNPTINEVNINIANQNNDNITIELTNSIGANIYKEISNETIINKTISLEKFDAGIYFINIIQGQNKHSERIIKK